MYSEVAWVLVFSGTQVQPQIKLQPDYFPDYLSVSYDYIMTDLINSYEMLPENVLFLDCF